MKRESLEKLTLLELCDLLVDNTIQLLDYMDQKADGVKIRDLKENVELLQQIIREKRAVVAN